MIAINQHSSPPIRTHTEGALTTITPAQRRLDIPDVEALFDAVLVEIGLGHRHLILDFSEIEQVCPSTAGFLVDLKRRLQRQGGSLKLMNVSERVRQVLTMLGVWGSFEVLEPVGTIRDAG